MSAENEKTLPPNLWMMLNKVLHHRKMKQSKTGPEYYVYTKCMTKNGEKFMIKFEDLKVAITYFATYGMCPFCCKCEDCKKNILNMHHPTPKTLLGTAEFALNEKTEEILKNCKNGSWVLKRGF